MDKQIIISIGRLYGSDGKDIGRKIAEALNISFYDRNIIEHLADEMQVDAEQLKKYEEKKKNIFFSRTVKGHSNAPEDHVANHQFDYIRRLADSKKSFVIVGRCAESVLKDNKNLITIFVTGDRDVRIKRVMEKFSLSRAKAADKMDRHDRTRKAYHNYYSDTRWGDPEFYDICINSSKLGVEKTANAILRYINDRIGE